MQLRTFQLSNESHGAYVDTENGQTMACAGFCHVQNGAVTAEADHSISMGKLPIQSVEINIPGQFIVSVHIKRQANSRLYTGLTQDTHCLPNGIKISVPIGIGR